jgi:hypothetical protein
MSDDLGYPAAPAWDEGIAALVGRLPDLVSEGHLTINDARVIQYLAGRPKAARTARCPVCIVPATSGPFRAETDEELFALIANHTIEVHNGGPVDAFDTAESVLPLVGRAYRKDAEARPWLYQPGRDRPGPIQIIPLEPKHSP